MLKFVGAELIPDRFERKELELRIGLILGGGAEGADALARLLDTFVYAIEGGVRGVEAMREGLLTAIELAYLRTGEHAAALRLYRLSLEGRLRVEDEPARLIGAAIGRRTAGARELTAEARAGTNIALRAPPLTKPRRRGGRGEDSTVSPRPRAFAIILPGALNA